MVAMAAVHHVCIIVYEGMHDKLSTSQQVLPSQMKTVTMDTDEHDLNNPLYAEAAKDPVTDVKNGNLMSPSMLLFFFFKLEAFRLHLLMKYHL